MQGCIDASNPRRRPGATPPLFLAFLILAAAGAAPAAGQSPAAPAPATREVDVRSFLGDPLNLRIALPRNAEGDSAGVCQSVIDTDKRDNALRSADLMLTMVELRDIRYLEVRSRAAFREPIARFTLRLGCPDEKVIDREFTVLIDPSPVKALPVAASATAAPSATDKGAPLIPVSGSWTVVEGDTLARLARAIYPRNSARQRQYIIVLRELNEELGNVGDNAPLPAGTKLALPDLLTMSGIPPGQTFKSATRTPPAKAQAPAAVGTDIKPATPEKPSPRVDSKPVPAPNPARVVPSARATPPPAPARPVESKPSPAKPDAAKTETAKPAQSAASKSPPAGDGFQLRLSGAQMDLTRSRNVSEAQRDILREKQLILDSDDQVAALLSLKNTVKQLEQRLNEIQLKTSKTTAVPAAAPAAAPAAPTAVPPVTATAPATTAPKSPEPTAPVASPPTVTVKDTPVTPNPGASTPPAATPEKNRPVEATPAPSIPEPSLTENLASYLPSPLITGGILAGLAALFAAWAWSRRSQKPARDSNRLMRHGGATSKTVMPPASQLRADENSVPDEEFEKWEGTPSEFAAQAASLPPPEPEQPHDATLRMDSGALQPPDHPVDAPVIFDDTPASFELDSSPATTVDFLVGMDEKLPEDRVRRLQYMHERYPELKSNTVSIDDPDSIINAARLYYDEAEKANGADKASELLTFAVEERPQQMRYWLAQFEIFRLENMVSEFSALASKFHVLFSHTTAWPKVRQIGHEMDPGNTLFAGGIATPAADTRFDPIAENWLNAPMDFTSDALMSDLRLALLDDHGVSRADFESITARLTASAGGH